MLREVDHKLDGVGDQQVRRFERETFGCLSGVRRQLGERALRRRGVQRRHRAIGALRHRVEEREDFFARASPDDDPIRRHAQRPPHQIGKGDLPFAFDVRLSSFERDDIRMQIGVAVQAQLEGVLDGDEPLP